MTTPARIMPARRRFAALAPAVALLALAGAAHALPTIMDRVPADAALTLVIPNPAALEKDAQGIAQLAGLPADVVNIRQLLSAAGPLAGSVNLNSPVALVITQIHSPDSGREPSALILMEITDYDRFVKDGGGTPGAGAGGVDELSINDEPGFIKKVAGNLVALSPTRDTLESYTTTSGHAAAQSRLVGPRGEATIERAGDSFIVVNFSKIPAEAIEELKSNLAQGVDQALRNARPSLPEGLDPAKVTDLVTQHAEAFFKDTRAAVLCLGIDNLGVSLDSLLVFNDNTPLARAFADPGNPSALTGKLPNIPYLFTASIDPSAPGLARALQSIEIPEWIEEFSKLNTDGIALTAQELKKTIAVDRGSAALLGVSPGGLTGGLLNKTIVYNASADVPFSRKAAGDRFSEGAFGELATTKYEPASADVDGKKVDTYQIRFRNAPGQPPFLQQVFAVLYGFTGGPSGYIAPVDGGLYTTIAKDSDLLTAAFKAHAGGPSLAGDQLIQQVSRQMPQGRIGEFYVGTRSILESVLPILSFVGVDAADFDLPEKLPPIGGALTSGQGAIGGTIYIPAPVIKTYTELGLLLRGAAGNFGGGNGNNNPDF